MAFHLGIAFQSRLGFASLNLPSSSNYSSKQLLLQSLLTGQGKRHFKTPIRLSSANASSPSANQAEEEQINNTFFTPTTTSSSSSWAEFAEKVSGEWDGFGADFSKEGEPIELPESVVPEAYREWEVKVYDWQTQCPTLALALPPFQLSYKLIRLLPTVGCEADAATRYSVFERDINSAAAFAYQSNGCYVAVWRLVDGNDDSLLLELEHCLIDPRDRESRVRIVQAVLIQEKNDQVQQPKLIMQLQGLKVFREQWYGPYRNGDQLGGCAIRDSAFASTQPMETSQVTGGWRGHPAIANFQQHDSDQNTNILELQLVDDESVPKSWSRDSSSLILLPKLLWCSSNQREELGETCFQVGWLLDKGVAITSKCSFSGDAKLKEIAIACETAEVMIN